MRLSGLQRYRDGWGRGKVFTGILGFDTFAAMNPARSESELRETMDLLSSDIAERCGINRDAGDLSHGEETMMRGALATLERKHLDFLAGELSEEIRKLNVKLYAWGVGFVLLWLFAAWAVFWYAPYDARTGFGLVWLFVAPPVFSAPFQPWRNSKGKLQKIQKVVASYSWR